MLSGLTTYIKRNGSLTVLVALALLLIIVVGVIAVTQDDETSSKPPQSSTPVSTLSSPLSSSQISDLAGTSPTSLMWFGPTDDESAIRMRLPDDVANGNIELAYFNEAAVKAFAQDGFSYTAIIKTTTADASAYEKLFNQTAPSSKQVKTNEDIIVFYPKKTPSNLMFALGKSNGKTVLSEILLSGPQKDSVLKETALRISYIPRLS